MKPRSSQLYIFQDQTLKEALATSLNIQSPKKLDEVTDNVFSSLLLYGIKCGDVDVVKKLLGEPR